MNENLNFHIQFLWMSLYQCNLNCSYCSNIYLTKENQQIPLIQTDSLVRSLDQSGKICRIVFTGGEPFLIPNFVTACQKITQNHRIIVISNFTTPRIKEFAETIDPARAGFLASLHIRELEKRNLTDRFIENVHYCRSKGFHVDIEEVAYPGLKDDAGKYRDFFNSKGINFKFVPYSGFYNEGKYPNDYTNSDIQIFQLKKSDLKRYNRRAGYCNAGFNHFIVMPDGFIFKCFRLAEYCGNIYEKIPESKQMIKCSHTYCECCTSKIDKPLFRAAIKQAKYLVNV